jgi:hypothetical protein
MEKKKRIDLGPFTLDEAKELLLRLEDDLWVASSRAASVEFILGSLLLELNREGGLDGMAFTRKLQEQVQDQPMSCQVSAGLMLAQLQAAFSGGGQSGYVLH